MRRDLGSRFLKVFLALALLCTLGSTSTMAAKPGKPKNGENQDPNLVAIKPLGILIGYYNKQKDLFYYSVDAPQKVGGYCDTYDKDAFLANCQIEWLPIYFEYDNRKWRIELWKGAYGQLPGLEKLNTDLAKSLQVSTGCEIGVYYQTHESTPKKSVGKKILDIITLRTLKKAVKEGLDVYDCACNAQDALVMSSKLYNKQKELLLERDSTEIDNLSGKHWWLCGFTTKYHFSPSELSMHASITMKDAKMADAFEAGLKVAKGGNGAGAAKNISRKGTTFDFDWE